MVTAPKSAKVSAPDVRKQVVEALVRWESKKGNFDRLSQDFLFALPASRRPFYTELSKGVLRNLKFLDFKAEKISSGKLADLPSWIRNVLRLGGYQLEHSPIPKPVTVYLMVELAKFHGYERLAGLVNRILRKWAAGEAPALPANPVEDLSVRYSHPAWLVERWANRFGHGKTERLLHWNNLTPALEVYINPLRITPKDFIEICKEKAIEPVPSQVPGAFFIDPPRAVEKIPGFLEGFFWIQGISALLPVYLLSADPGQTVVDLCAAPGGKSCQIAAMMNNTGEVVAVDVDPERLAKVDENRRRLGMSCIHPVLADGREFGKLYSRHADAVLLDAPCSATGMFRKKVDARWNRSPQDLDQFSTLQGDLLESAAQAVKPGGILVYSTCSLEPEENETVVQTFLQRHPEFVLDDPDPYLPDAIREQLDLHDHVVRILPHEHRLDGFFMARLKHQGDS